jgi:hypothetical protein
VQPLSHHLPQMSCRVHKLNLLLVRLRCFGRLHKRLFKHATPYQSSAPEQRHSSCQACSSYWAWYSGKLVFYFSGQLDTSITYTTLHVILLQSDNFAKHRTPTMLLSSELKAMSMHLLPLFVLFPAKTCRVTPSSDVQPHCTTHVADNKLSFKD